MPSIFISAGELSGDLHGGLLVKEIIKKRPDVQISAIGGDNMLDAGTELLFHIRETSFMGFTEVIKHLPLILRIWRTTLDYIDKIRPDLVVLIDYPGFNLRLAKAASKRGIPVVYYISPQIWAWHQSRIRKIPKYVRRVLCILPFEEEWFRSHNVNATFVGHPLLDRIEVPHDVQINNERSYQAGDPVQIGLFPGSRKSEIERHLPVMIAAVEELRKQFHKLNVSIAIATGMEMQIHHEKYRHNWIQWVSGKNGEIMRHSDVLILASGTVTLEAAIYQTPMVVIYRTSHINYWLGRLLVKVHFITIANLITNKRGVTELIQHDATPAKIASEVKTLLTNSQYNKAMRQFLKEVTRQLGTPGASARAADAILSFLPKRSADES